MLNGQQIYNKVRAYLLKQNEQSIYRGECKYRGPRGLKCAAGVLISDENYISSFEGKMINEAVEVVQALIDSGVDPVWLDLVRGLQSVHDRYQPTGWPLQLTYLAKSYGLKP